MTSTPSSREARITMRATARQRALIQQAADALDTSVTDFVLDSASAAAERVLADRRWFTLTSHDWEEFQTLLERPVVEKPRLAALVNEPSPFSG
jgi:uncharacterized protein (DUF1778 family)